MTDYTRRIAVICNPYSGKGKPLKWLVHFQAFLANHQIPFSVFTTDLPDNLTHYTDIIILGGDGTLNYTLNHFKEISLPIGIIPCGTGNDFAFHLLGKQHMDSYFHTAVFGDVINVDAGICNNKYFLNGVGIGFDGWVVKKLLAKKLFTGMAAYYSTVISLLFFYKESEVQIKYDGNSYLTPLFMLCAANGPTYGGGFKVAPKASIHSNKLDVLTVSKISLLNRLIYLPIIENGKHLDKEIDFVKYQQASRIQVNAAKPLQAHLDGEWLQSSTFDIHILPNYLKVRK